MIYQMQNIPPLIDFGFGITSKQVAAGQPVTVWLATLFNQEAYTFMLWAEGSTSINKISDYEHQVVYNTPGSYAISMAIANREIKIPLQSNIINLTVI